LVYPERSRKEGYGNVAHVYANTYGTINTIDCLMLFSSPL